MYSDVWMRIKGYNMTSPISVNETVNIYKWLNKRNEPIGVCVNFELADDVHYELKIEEWNKFLNCVLMIDESDDFIKPFQKFLTIRLPQAAFADVLNKNNIEYKKISFY